MYFLIFSLNENGKNLCGESPRTFGSFYANRCHHQFGICYQKQVKKYRESYMPNTVSQ